MTAILVNAAPPAGFSDPVQQAQRAFRGMLDALARPGRSIEVEHQFGHPANMAPSLAAILLTLCDLDTPVLLGSGFYDSVTRDWLRFHTGAPLTGNTQLASIALLDSRRMPALEGFALGTDEAPEKGATLLIQVETFDGACMTEWSGPGIKSVERIPSLGLPDSFWRQRALLSNGFPRGLDIYFCHGAKLLGLPRSTILSFPEA